MMLNCLNLCNMAKINRFLFSEFLGEYVDGKFGSVRIGKAFHEKFDFVRDEDLLNEETSSVAIRKIWSRHIVQPSGQPVWDGES